MTARLPRLSALSDVVGRDESSSGARIHLRVPDRVPVTGDMVDEAVESVIKESAMKADLANVLMYNLGKDSRSGVANAYYTSRAVARSASVGVARHNVNIKYALPDADVAALVEYAPEFKLRFSVSENHDHPMAAACRMIDHRLVLSRIPHGISVGDIGGNPLVHIRAGRANVHVCGPELDRKDHMRHLLRRMEARQLARNSDQTIAGMAGKFLEKDPEFVCMSSAQACNHQSSVLTSIHVYDIPITDWPSIMEAKGAQVVEGCMLFSDKFFVESAGELSVSKARYEIDVAGDKFNMGFASSPSWWYSHKWSQLALYGTDQLLAHNGRTYSYKVVEKRGDTLFFRILPLDRSVRTAPAFTSRRLPGVPMVRVNGFDLSPANASKGANMIRKQYVFPRNLWYEMVSQAAEDYERGVMDFTRMYNHYRTVSVKQTINAVLVMGGDRVSAEELVPLVVHSCLAAASASTLGQRTTRGITDSVLRTRFKSSESTMRKMAEALRAVVGSMGRLAVRPAVSFASLMTNWSVSLYEQWLLEWEPVVEDTVIPATALRTVGFKSDGKHAVTTSVDHFKDYVRSTAPFDHYAAVVSDPVLCGLLTKVCPQAIVPVEHDVSGNDTQSLADTVPSYRTGVDDAALQAVRKAAVVEHMDEIRAENRAVSDTCSKAYSLMYVRGKPSLELLRKNSELFRNPDFWLVRNGTVVESVRGIPVSDFHHAAVFTPSVDSNTGSRVRAVVRSEWKADDAQTVNVNFVLADETYTGWTLVTDDLIIHNGPEILASMDAALRLPHNYSVVVNRAPPGSGKTYAIVHEVERTGADVVMCPVRESIEDTRKQVLKLHAEFPDPRLRIRTVDSYLVNRGVQQRTTDLSANRLLADEVYMAHAGKWYAAAALLGVGTIQAYGDEMQIPHIPRAQATSLHVKISAQSHTDVWTTRRCPPSAVAAWGEVYDWKVRSISDNPDGGLSALTDSKTLEIPDGCVMMCMYQADKLLVRLKYGNQGKRIKVLTAHESEGKTYKHVWLHRFDLRKRTDSTSLFDQRPHVLVAMSRHTHSFKYIRGANLNDLVDQWIVRSKDPRRLAAAADAATQGQSIERL